MKDININHYKERRLPFIGTILVKKSEREIQSEINYKAFITGKTVHEILKQREAATIEAMKKYMNRNHDEPN